MPNLDTSEAQAFGEKIRSAFEGQRFMVNGEIERVTVSVGVALWPAHGDTYQEVLEAANGAELEAKKGRNSVTIARA
jgi:GGDEF domain-containing protein